MQLISCCCHCEGCLVIPEAVERRGCGRKGEERRREEEKRDRKGKKEKELCDLSHQSHCLSKRSVHLLPEDCLPRTFSKLNSLVNWQAILLSCYDQILACPQTSHADLLRPEMMMLGRRSCHKEQPPWLRWVPLSKRPETSGTHPSCEGTTVRNFSGSPAQTRS